MQFSKTAAVLIAFVATAAPALATDYRQLYNFTSGNGVAFCNSWRCACINYVPNNTNLTFVGGVCEEGDYHGKHKNSQAKAFCVFGNGQKNTDVSKHIAAATNATLAS